VKRRARFTAVLAVLVAVATAISVEAASATSVGAGSAARATPHKVIVGYFTQWGIYGRNYTVNNVETSGSAAKLDILNYAFGNVAPNTSGDVVCQSGDTWADYQTPYLPQVDGVVPSPDDPMHGNFQQLKELKTLHPDLKVLISLGGWSWSKYFSDAALTRASREKFVASCIDLFIKGNLPDLAPGAGAGVFDGIDLDWEWPGSEGNTGNIIRPADKQNFTLLVKEFRRQLDKYGNTQTKRDYLLTAFLPAARSYIDAGFEVRKIFRDLDYGNVQGYDLHGAFESQTNHQANLFSSPADPSSPRYSVDDTVNAYLERGAPAEKIVIGAPFYSRGWTGVGATNNGLYQSSTGPAPGVWEGGVNDYRVAKGLLENGFNRYYDSAAGDAWLFDGTTFWTFDDPSVMQLKGQYVNRRGLGGIMFWELSGDTSDGELISSIASSLSPRSSRVHTHGSTFDRARSSLVP